MVIKFRITYISNSPVLYSHTDVITGNYFDGNCKLTTNRKVKICIEPMIESLKTSINLNR